MESHGGWTVRRTGWLTVTCTLKFEAKYSTETFVYTYPYGLTVFLSPPSEPQTLQSRTCFTFFISKFCVSVFLQCIFAPNSYSFLPNLSETAHTQRVPYSKQLLHIQHRPYVFGRLRQEENGRHSPTPTFFSVFTHIFLNFFPVFWGGGDI